MENITELLALIRKEYFSLGVAFFAIQIFIAVVVIAATVFIKKYTEALAILPNLEKKLRIIEDVKQEYYELKANIELIKDNQAKIFDEERNCLLEYYEEYMERRKELILIRISDIGKRDLSKNILDKIDKIAHEIDEKLIVLKIKMIRVGFYVTDSEILSLVDEMYQGLVDYASFIGYRIATIQMAASPMYDSNSGFEIKKDSFVSVNIDNMESKKMHAEFDKATEDLSAKYVKAAQKYITSKYQA